MDVPVSAEAVIDETNDARGDSKAQSFASAGLGQNESVDANDVAVGIYERTSAIAGVDGGVGLNVDEGTVGIGLARDRTHNSHGPGVLKPLGTAHGEDQLSLMPRAAAAERQGGKSGLIRLHVDLQDSEIRLFMKADEPCINDVLLADGRDLIGEIDGRQGKRNADALGSLDNVRVGDDVAVGIDDNSGADCVLSGDVGGLTVAAFFDGAIARH